MQGRVRECAGPGLMALLALVIGGCASVSGLLPEVQPPESLPTGEVSSVLLSEPSGLVDTDSQEASVLVAAAAQRGLVESPPSPEAAKETGSDPGQPSGQKDPQARDEDYDPFAKKEEELTGKIEEYDPWEGYNVSVFEFNHKLDRYLIKPVAKLYNRVVPDAVQRGIGNLFRNARFVPRFFNNLFQGKFRGAGVELSRFAINSTLGIGGLFDPAKNWLELTTPDEDAGQTLGYYGMKPGPYLILPFLPPYTVRDGLGFVIDLALDPINWFLLPFIEVGGAPKATTGLEATLINLGSRVGFIVNERSLNLETYEGVEEATLDLYTAVRNGYLQRRARAIRE